MKSYEITITDKFYIDYKKFKDKIFENLVAKNIKFDKLTLYKKSQKLLDRFLFIWFSEKNGLLPPNTVQSIIDQWSILKQNDAEFTLYSRFQRLFGYLDSGKKFETYEIPAYNGGLFKPDSILDHKKTVIEDHLLLEHCTKLSEYDFNTDIDVNILGHIFEHSLNEIDEITAELNGTATEKPKSKRKKDGIFYTPKFVTGYMVQNTIGKLCEDKREQIQLLDLEVKDEHFKNGKATKVGKELIFRLQEYKKWLLSLKILDPACGSGAFLNAALEFLIQEHKQIDDALSILTGDSLRMMDTDKSILENNIFGVDINEESVEIAKLSLWLRTAKKDRKLSDLNGNIKCGNSLCSSSKVAGKQAFDWNVEFSKIMKNGGFDVIIGNPPYRIVFNEPEKSYFEHEYPEFKRNNDLYVAFICKSLTLLNDNGFFSFITPNSFIRGDYFKDLRSKLASFQINEIIDFGTKIIFEDANVYTSILSLKKTLAEFAWPLKNDLQSIRAYVQAQKTDFIPKSDLFTKLSLLTKFSNYFQIKDVGYNYWSEGRGKVRNGGSIGDLVLYEGKQADSRDIPYLKGSQIKRYFAHQPVNFLKHDYKSFLGKNDTFRFSPEILETVPKLVYRQTSSKLIATIDVNAYHVDKTLHCIVAKPEWFAEIDLHFVLALFNSRLMNYYYSILTEETGRTFAQVKTIYIKDLPFILCEKETQNSFARYAQRLIDLNTELQKKADTFIKRLRSNFKIESVSSKLANFYEFDFKTCLSELLKQKIVITLKQQDEWEAYFESYKIEINAFQLEIIKIENELDHLVYKLFQLSEDEIDQVEKHLL